MDWDFYGYPFWRIFEVAACEMLLVDIVKVRSQQQYLVSLPIAQYTSSPQKED